MYHIKYITTFVIIYFSTLFSVYSFENPDSSEHNRSVKLDLIPFYNDFFDSKIQARIGAEFDCNINRKFFFSGYLDIGLYDKYKYVKYYDFFNETTGLYSIDHNISIYGIHILPGINCKMFHFKKERNSVFSGLISDVSFYRKHLYVINNNTQENYSVNYNQIRIGTGVSLGSKYYFTDRFYTEIKTSFLFNDISRLSSDYTTPIRSLDALWTSSNYLYWWLLNIKIGYAF